MVSALQPVMNACPVCGAPALRPRAVYCSGRCSRKAEVRRYWARHKEKLLERARARYAANPDKWKACQKKNKERIAVRMKKWAAENRESRREYRRQVANESYRRNPAAHNARRKRWLGKNPEYLAAQQARHRAGQLKATPKWLTPEQRKLIRVYYQSAVLATGTSGEPHEVDHFVPLRGKTVCGLHVPWNLRIIPQFMNREKSNRHDSSL